MMGKFPDRTPKNAPATAPPTAELMASPSFPVHVSIKASPALKVAPTPAMYPALEKMVGTTCLATWARFSLTPFYGGGVGFRLVRRMGFGIVWRGGGNTPTSLDLPALCQKVVDVPMTPPTAVCMCVCMYVCEKMLNALI